MSSNSQLFKQTLSAWSEGYNGALIVARILARQTGIEIPESLPNWENRHSLFQQAVLHQRRELIKVTLQPELRHLFLALDTLAPSYPDLVELLAYHYLLRLDRDTLAALLAQPLAYMDDALQKGKTWIENFYFAQLHTISPWS